MNELPLRQRLAASASGLAYATLPDGKAIEEGLRYCRASSKLQLNEQHRSASSTSGTKSKIQKARRRGSTRETSFRSLPHDDVLNRIEDDFSHFYHQPVQVFHDPISTPSHPRDQSCGEVDRHQDADAWQTTRSAHQQSLDETGEAKHDVVSHLNLNDLHQAQRQEDVLSSASVRLNQVMQHLSLASPAGSAARYQQREPQHTNFSESAEEQPHTLASNTQSHDRMEHFHRPQVHTREDNDEPEPDQEFHCPYIDCHKNLFDQNVSLSALQQQRTCVHVGCAFVSETARGWLRHVLGPHHNLQSQEPSDP